MYCHFHLRRLVAFLPAVALCWAVPVCCHAVILRLVAEPSSPDVGGTQPGPGSWQLYCVDDDASTFGISTYNVKIDGATSIAHRSPVSSILDSNGDVYSAGFNQFRAVTSANEIQAGQPLPGMSPFLLPGFGKSAGDFATAVSSIEPGATVASSTSPTWGDATFTETTPYDDNQWMLLAEGTYDGITEPSIAAAKFTVFNSVDFRSRFAEVSVWGHPELDPVLNPVPAPPAPPVISPSIPSTNPAPTPSVNPISPPALPDPPAHPGPTIDPVDPQPEIIDVVSVIHPDLPPPDIDVPPDSPTDEDITVLPWIDVPFILQPRPWFGSLEPFDPTKLTPGNYWVHVGDDGQASIATIDEGFVYLTGTADENSYLHQNAEFVNFAVEDRPVGLAGSLGSVRTSIFANHGMALAYGTTVAGMTAASGQQQTPEPASAILAALAVAFLWSFRRHRG